ncbi:diguanylate cyclase domain-containing protein [Scytonema sp. NUACC26]|uniref:GGDEF domain-containing protein n=1 Tax=Scytonema sp. NUACC26 TaxID=3140176 RepID=UPI0034DC6645
MRIMGIPGNSKDFQFLPGSFSLHFLVKQAVVVSFLIGGLVLLNWVFDILRLKSTSMGIPTLKTATVVSCIIAGVLLWLWYGQTTLMSGDGAGSLMARKLLPMAILLPMLVKGICAIGYRYSVCTVEIQFTIEGVLNIIVFSGLVYWIAYRLNDLDWHRSQAEQALQRLNTELKQLCTANIKLQHLATEDHLTKVANRRQFDKYLHQQWQQHQEEQTPLSLIMCDIDHFKLYNDHYGHQAGDECLKQVARSIRDVVRSFSCLLARYGGEELAIVLPNTTSNDAIAIAEQIQLSIARTQIAHDRSPISEYLTLSVGVATTVPNSERLPENLIELADEALYAAKEQGRNRSCLLLS